MKTAGLAAVMLLASVAPGAAQLRYVDRHGVVHWVQTRQQIPPEYRDKAEAPAMPHIDLGEGEDRRARERRKAFEHDSLQHGAEADSERDSQRAAERSQRAAERSQADFQRAVDRCRKRAGVQAVVKPGEKVSTLGTAREQFRFDECMTKSGKPLE